MLKLLILVSTPLIPINTKSTSIDYQVIRADALYIDYCKSQQSHNNLDPITYQHGTMSGGKNRFSTWRFEISHVDIRKRREIRN